VGVPVSNRSGAGATERGVSVLFCSPYRWQAHKFGLKNLEGAVEYEFTDHDGRPVFVDLNPRVEYVEEREPTPWCVVADKGARVVA
jgi:hypothetical protein